MAILKNISVKSAEIVCCDPSSETPCQGVSDRDHNRFSNGEIKERK